MIADFASQNLHADKRHHGRSIRVGCCLATKLLLFGVGSPRQSMQSWISRAPCPLRDLLEHPGLCLYFCQTPVAVCHRRIPKRSFFLCWWARARLCLFRFSAGGADRYGQHSVRGVSKASRKRRRGDLA